MKKLKLLAGLSILCMNSSLFAGTIYVNNEKIAVETQLVNNSNYVPIRFVAETLGAKVEWQKPNVIVKKDNMELTLTIDDNTVSVNGQKFSVPYVPYLSNNTTYVPLRLISEQLNCDVTADDQKNVYIISKGEAISTPVIPEDKNAYGLSPNGLWGAAKETRYLPHTVQHVFYMKDMTTGLYKEIYATVKAPGLSHAYWQYDNRLVITGINGLKGEADNPRIMIYDPTTDTFETLVDNIEGCRLEYQTTNLIYHKDGKYYYYDFSNGTHELLEDEERGEHTVYPRI